MPNARPGGHLVRRSGSFDHRSPGEGCVSLRWPRTPSATAALPNAKLCGATAQSSGAELHADHIEAVSRELVAPTRSDERSNLVLPLQHRKPLDGPAADFRKPTAA